MNIFNVKFDSFLVFYSIPAVYCAIGCFIFYIISITEPSPYIDEIFHIGQCQQYCRGNFFIYDPKLTTPPGLYVLTLLVLAPVLKLFDVECSVNTLRFINYIASLLLVVLIYRILKVQIYHCSNIKKLWVALNLCTFPVLFFFSFFYYTDVVSTFLVLLTFHLYNINYSHMAGFVGLVSVTVRQTNLVWFFCFASIKCCKNVENEMYKDGKSVSEAKRRKLSYILVIVKECWNLIQKRSVFYFVELMLKETYFFVIAVLAFSWLIIRNGSLVLGDKSSHVAVVHLPQLLYFSLFTAVFSFPLCIIPALRFLKRCVKFYKYVVLAVILIGVVVAANTMAHLFLLSDNRHYTFYIWKRVFEKPLGRYGVIPLYIVSLYCIAENTSHMDAYTKLGYAIATVIVLVPQKLLEFRYFIVPYLLYRIETYHRNRWWHLSLEILFNLLINFLTISFFVQLPFKWPDGSTQRFSW